MVRTTAPTTHDKSAADIHNGARQQQELGLLDGTVGKGSSQLLAHRAVIAHAVPAEQVPVVHLVMLTVATDYLCVTGTMMLMEGPHPHLQHHHHQKHDGRKRAAHCYLTTCQSAIFLRPTHFLPLHDKSRHTTGTSALSARKSTTFFYKTNRPACKN